jgi:hypothetical protein
MHITVSPLDLHKFLSRAYRATLAGVPRVPGMPFCRWETCGNAVAARHLWDFCRGDRTPLSLLTMVRNRAVGSVAPIPSVKLPAAARHDPAGSVKGTRDNFFG